MEGENSHDQVSVTRCILCNNEFVGQQYLAIAPRIAKKATPLQYSQVYLVVRFHRFMGEPADICWDCSKQCIKEAYDGSRGTRHKFK